MSSSDQSMYRNLIANPMQVPFKKRRFLYNSAAGSTEVENATNDGALDKSIPQKTDRLHWDLNLMMDDWKEPNAESLTNDGTQNGKPTIGEPACYVDSLKDESSKDLQKYSGKDPKLTSEDLSSGCRDSNFSGNNMGHVISVECMSNLQSGYDSPIEDGELREPDTYVWKNSKVDCLETGQRDNEKVGADYIDAFENNYKNRNQLWNHQDDANAKEEDSELNDNGSQTREFGAGKYRKKLSSHDESPYNGPIQRTNFPFRQRQR
ncbi:uncharacterized protein LOC141708226 isoform X1 [Apium graveolens]|uniref:uncharacterized protein LOC141708226 isoform X1 n=1 Tax=Apium graveolens TaxID=4045 RepID=UPI003D7BCD32